MSPEVASLSAVVSTAASQVGSQLIEYLIAGLATVMCSLAAWATSKFCAWIDVKTHGTALQTAGDAAENIIMAVEQETVKAARDAYNDGKITKEELNAIFETAKKTAVDRFNAYVATLPKTIRSTIEAKAQSLLESALGRLKLNGLVASLEKKPAAAPANDAGASSPIPAPTNPTPAPASK